MGPSVLSFLCVIFEYFCNLMKSLLIVCVLRVHHCNHLTIVCQAVFCLPFKNQPLFKFYNQLPKLLNRPSCFIPLHGVTERYMCRCLIVQHTTFSYKVSNYTCIYHHFSCLICNHITPPYFILYSVVLII